MGHLGDVNKFSHEPLDRMHFKMTKEYLWGKEIQNCSHEVPWVVNDPVPGGHSYLYISRRI